MTIFWLIIDNIMFYLTLTASPSPHQLQHSTVQIQTSFIITPLLTGTTSSPSLLTAPLSTEYPSCWKQTKQHTHIEWLCMALQIKSHLFDIWNLLNLLRVTLSMYKSWFRLLFHLLKERKKVKYCKIKCHPKILNIYKDIFWFHVYMFHYTRDC